MKAAVSFFVIGVLILVFLYFVSDISFQSSTVDIQVHDTYFVLTRFSFFLFVILFLGTFSSLGGVIGTRFKNTAFIVLFFILLLIDAYIVWSMNNSFQQV